MEDLGRWGERIFIPQVVFGCLTYISTDGYSFAAALFVAGVVAAIGMTLAVIINDVAGVAVAMSSILATGAIIVPHSVLFLTIFLGFISLVAAVLAAMIVRNRKPAPKETLWLLTLAALPVVGAVVHLYLFSQSNEERGKIGRG